jgi:tetratricopeptide (TPR) repeat protein
MRIFLALCLLCGLSSLEAATLPTCTPSRACALDRAQRLVLDYLTADPAAKPSMAATATDAAQLLSSLMLRDPREYRSGFTRRALQKMIAADQEALLEAVARQLIERQRDALALEVILDIKGTTQRNSLYQDMALAHVRTQRFDLAYWAAGRMQVGGDRDRVLLTIAEGQLQAEQSIAAGQTAALVMERTRALSATRDDTLRIQAQAAAQLGDAKRALEVAGRITQAEPFAAALKSIADLQIERDARTEALATVRFYREQLRRGRSTLSARLEIAERLSRLGAEREALELVQGSAVDQARTLAAIAVGAARDGRFAEALAALEKTPSEQRNTIRNAAALIAQLRILSGVDFGTAFGSVGTFSPLSPQERSAWVRNTAQALVQRDNLAAARDGLNYEVENALQETGCASADCAPITRIPASKCDFGPRDESLCNAAILQAQLGFTEDADRAVNFLRSQQASITVTLAVADGLIAAGRPVLARRTFDRALRLARLEPNLSYFHGTLKAYASWVATAPEQQEALTEIDAATRELTRLDKNAGCRTDGALLAVTTAHASAGQFATAFTLTETQLQCQQVNAYLRIYEHGRPSLRATILRTGARDSPRM